MKQILFLTTAILFLQACQAGQDPIKSPVTITPEAPSSPAQPISKTQDCKIMFEAKDSLKKIAMKAAQMKQECHLSEAEIMRAAND
ncbi:MAG: hypothetical protein ACXWQQ_16315 [Pseudobdellovibrio sp.]